MRRARFAVVPTGDIEWVGTASDDKVIHIDRDSRMYNHNGMETSC